MAGVISGDQKRVRILTISVIRHWALPRRQPGLIGPSEVPRIVARAHAGVVRICPASDVFAGADRVIVQVETGEQEPPGELLLLRRGRHFVAMVNRCPHLGRTLEDATVRGGALVCPGHGRGYSTRPRRTGTGAALCLLPVRGDGDAVLIEIQGLIAIQAAADD